MGKNDEMTKGARAYGKKIGAVAVDLDEAARPMREAAADRMAEIGMRQGDRLGTVGQHLGTIISAGMSHGIAPGRWVDALWVLHKTKDVNALFVLTGDTPNDCSHGGRLAYVNIIKKIAIACMDEVALCVEPGRDAKAAIRGYLEILCSAISQAMMSAGIAP